MSGAPAQRLAALDGLRGWAALSVVVFHLTWECFGALFPVLRTIPAALFANGNFAVALFLMVSGYVLTIRGWRSEDKSAVFRSILKRYFRLTVPILGAVLIYWAVISLGLVMSHQAAGIVHRPEWLGSFARMQPDPVDAIGYGLLGVYLRVSAGGYGPFLWTMIAELWGSYVVLALCLFELRGRWSYLPLAALTVLSLFTAFKPIFPLAACYPAGAIVALLAKDGIIGTQPPDETESVVATGVFAAALVAAAIAEATAADLSVTTVLAMVAFVAALRSGLVSRFLSMPASQWLGRISFPLYLLQIVVITTLTSGLIVLADRAGTLNLWTALGIGGVSTVACLLAAQFFMPIERFSLKLAAEIGGKGPAGAVVSPASASGRPRPAANR